MSLNPVPDEAVGTGSGRHRFEWGDVPSPQSPRSGCRPPRTEHSGSAFSTLRPRRRSPINRGAVVEGVGNATRHPIDWGDVPSARRTGSSARRHDQASLNGAMFVSTVAAIRPAHPNETPAAARFPRFVHGAGSQSTEARWSKGWGNATRPPIEWGDVPSARQPDRPHVATTRRVRLGRCSLP